MLVISKWFKIEARFGFCHKFLLKLSSMRGKRNKKKKHNLGTGFFIFKFLKFRNRFLVSAQTNISEQLWILPKLHYFFVKTSTHCKTMPLHPSYCLACFYSYIKLYCHFYKSEGILRCMGQKSTFSHHKSMILFVTCL